MSEIGVATSITPTPEAKVGVGPPPASRRFLEDLPIRWGGSRVLVIGHVATRWALDHYLNRVALEWLATDDFAWQQGWEYQLGRSPRQ